ncbi:GGDEF domain-containing protein [Pseudomonas syringae]|uniref:diguanylate cyclase n=1 Tax=Pseudomonas syringae pv. papulans TaxID=83963 RepID=A0A0P9XGR3_PSESX|nr:GGDEF domain-containing protein [Pseudomonas syringae]KPY31166.1 Diguanylate cye [Pseudomonas syringae pv. papulans]KWS34982.1 diguanylate cyclase [Pseudomonas syringae pv. papulans]MDH4601957.1 GGDEF domain-containing protein [Pseudomonas syringae pv. papulans]MDH4624026.1 GGDEF domain-containing protein [Pseudomonas syringae pv. papulans]RMN45181.1 Diguanylate cye [Pseudomonas syringae pv. papulans]
MNGDMQARIKQLLSPAIARVQCIAIVCWLVVLSVTPYLQFGLPEMLLTLGLLGACAWQYRAVDFRVWRCMSMTFVIIVALCFSRAGHLRTGMDINWSLSVAVMIILCSTLLVVYTRDYLLVAVLAWCILSPVQGLDTDSVATLFMTLFFITSVSLGSVMNHTYTRTLRTVLSLEHQFRELSLTDDLTAILNRRALMQALDKHVLNNSAGYFLMLDIDDFKTINDQFGHDAGDQALRVMAGCLQKTVGSLAFGRMGGEEFGVILPMCSEDEAREYVLNLLDCIRKSLAVSPLTCSAGLADISAAVDSSEVLKTADINLYQAKRGGKDRAFWRGAQIGGHRAGGVSVECDKTRALTR